MPDIAQLMEFANKKGDGLLSLEEFGELLREPEIVSQTLKEQDIDYMEDVPKQANMVCDDASCSLSPDGGPASLVLKRNVSYQRLTLTPEYEQLYAAEEAMRLKKQHEVEQELELAKAEKIAREIERKEIEESQARDWKQIQEMRKMMAMEERWVRTYNPTRSHIEVCGDPNTRSLSKPALFVFSFRLASCAPSRTSRPPTFVLFVSLSVRPTPIASKSTCMTLRIRVMQMMGRPSGSARHAHTTMISQRPCVRYAMP